MEDKDKNWNSGNRNSGNRNSGNRNSGNRNSGNWNSGDCNSGDCNSGNRNSGNRNSGDWNSGNFNSGYFNIDEPKVRIFGKETNISRDEIYFPKWLFFNLTEWIPESDMTESQKENPDNSYYKTTGGISIEYEYKEAFKRSYEKASREDQLKVKDLPNFNADIFYEISGIRIDEEEKTELTLEQIADKFNISVDNLKIKK